MATKFSNNAFSTLSAGIDATQLTFDVASVSLFPDINSVGADYMYLSIIGSSYVEIVKVTSWSGTTLTVVRGRDGTTGTIASSGERVELRVTTAMLTDLTGDGEHATKGLAIAMSVAL